MAADNAGMKITSIGATSSTASSGSGTSPVIANLQKQILIRNLLQQARPVSH
jgi:hypothetical protein